MQPEPIRPQPQTEVLYADSPSGNTAHKRARQQQQQHQQKGTTAYNPLHIVLAIGAVVIPAAIAVSQKNTVVSGFMLCGIFSLGFMYLASQISGVNETRFRRPNLIRAVGAVAVFLFMYYTYFGPQSIREEHIHNRVRSKHSLFDRHYQEYVGLASLRTVR